MAQTSYDYGDIAELAVAFTVEGVPTDPTTITATVRKPDGTTTNYAVGVGNGFIIDDPGTGEFHLDVPLDQSGQWAFKFVGSGAAADVGAGTFFVKDDPTLVNTTVYTTLEMVKQAGNLNEIDYLDSDIYQCIRSASRAIDQYTNRRFYTTEDDEIRYYTPLSPSMVMIDDLVVLTELATDQNFDGTFEESWTENTDFILTPLNNDVDSRPWTRIELVAGWRVSKVFPSWANRSVRLTGKFGWATVPDPVIDAATILATQLVKRKREAPFGIIASTMEVGVAARIARKDPHICLLLDDFARDLPT